MDSYEATKVVFSRIQSLDPDNASKIMGYLLLQDHGDKDMIRLAFGPETLLLSLMTQAKTQLGILPSSSNSPSSAPSSPFNRPNPLSIPSASRFSNNSTNAFDITNPSSPSWPHMSPHTNSTPSSLSYASIVNGGINNCNNNSSNDLSDEYQLHHDHFAFLNESKNDDFLDPRLESSMSPTGYGGENTTLLHRRSFSVPGMCFGPEDAESGLGWKPCLYYARGFCKNGSGCKFVHGEDLVDGCSPIVGSPNKFNEFEQCQELLRSKAMAQQQQQQQKLAAASQFMAGTSFPFNKCMNFLLQQQNDSPRSAALMMEDDFHKFGRCRSGRNDFYSLGLGGAMSPGSRQIYLTFPADSVFREEDVSNYFSIYGPVQDVRIPYQQKRMFGFVTFLYSETVKLILAKGNPHFVCDSRVLVKPYKEKGKILDKKQQLMERGEFSACSSPSGINSREPFDLHLGSQMYYNAQEMLMRRRMEEQDNLQQAIELQERRIMNLQLLDLKSQGHHHLHHHQYQHNLSSGSPIPSPTLAHTPKNHSFDLPPNGVGQELPEENGGDPDAAKDTELEKDVSTTTCNYNNGNGNGSCEGKPNSEESDPNESLEHILPDNLFASPEKSTGDHNLTAFSTSSVEFDGIASNPVVSSSSNNTTLIPTNSSLTMSSSSALKSCFLQMPRLSSGHGAIGM